MQKLYLIIGLLFCLAANVTSQQVLILEKQNMLKNRKIPVGSKITVKTFDEDRLITGKMIYLSDSTIYLENGYAFDFKNVDYLVIMDKTTRFFSRFFYYSSIVGGVVMVNGFIHGDGFGSPSVYVPLAISGGLVAIGTALKLTEKKKYHIAAGKWRLKTIDFESIDLNKLKLD